MKKLKINHDPNLIKSHQSSSLNIKTSSIAAFPNILVI